MTIDEAIKILELKVASPFVKANPTTLAAIQLGIEALKLYRSCKGIGEHFDPALLQGETQ